MIRIQRVIINNFKQLREIDLLFPEKGRFLVQGKNESGKSNLFEAIFFGIFGQPLVTETPAQRFDDLIRYGVEKAYVELWLEVRDRLLKIYRTIRRKKANIWRLELEGPKGIEEVRGNRAVNQRIVAELGFDGEALLNSCFVEQKKLEKLEGMSQGDRERSLMMLLNLDNMMKIEEEFKIRAEDKLDLERCEQRHELAKTQAELPKAEEQLAEVEAKLRFITLKGKLEEVAREQRAIRRLEDEITALEQERKSLATKAKRVESLEEGMRALQEILNYLSRVKDQEREIKRLEQELEERERLRREELPALLKKLQGLQLLRTRLKRLESVLAVKKVSEEKIASVERAIKELEAKRRELKEEEERLGQIETQIESEALRGWLSVRGLDTALGQKRRKREQLARHLKLWGIGLLGSIALLIASALLRLPLGFSIATVLLAFSVFVWCIHTWRGYSLAAKELERSEWERKGATELEQRLGQLGFTPPTAEEIQIEELEEARAHLAEAERSLAQAETRHSEVRRRIQELESGIAAYDEKALREKDAICRGVIEKAEGILQRWKVKTEELAAEFGVEADLSIVQGLLGELNAEERQMRQKIEEIEDKKVESTERKEGINRLLETMEKRYRSVQGVVAAPAWSSALSVEDYKTLERSLRREFNRLGGEAVRRELEKVQGKINSRQGERRAREEKVVQMVWAAREVLTDLKLTAALSESPPLEEVEELLTKLEGLDLGDKEVLLRERDELLGSVSHLRERRDELESALGLEGEVLDLETCRKELERKRHELDVREVAVRIVGTARKRIMEKVLPSTMEHMRKLLPSLTMDRYYDAELTEEYRIRVWDERAEGWKEKNIFSGGTKDQFSLALRLAFALATLPEERGAAPSFIFLDEPLGSFDDERAKALQYLLIGGEIARSFDQIFLISHVRVSPRLFDYHIIMDNGRIVESNLPR